MTETAAFGTWKSPISAADVAAGAVGVSYPSVAGGEVWWQERRPSEGGRTAIVASGGADAPLRELLPAPWNARTRVHEYGGKAYLAVPSQSFPGGTTPRTPRGTSDAETNIPDMPLAFPGGTTPRTPRGTSDAETNVPDMPLDLVFANFADQRLYAVSGAVVADAGPVPLTPPDQGFRFADPVLSADGREVWCVRETVLPAPDGRTPAGFHLGGGVAVRREIVAVPLDGSAAASADAIRVLVSGAQFFAFPTPSPDGTRLAWVSWNHPNMPWDGTELRVGPVSRDTLDVADATLLMGGPDESVLAPCWHDDASLYVVSDASGWWNLYSVAASAGATPRPLHPLAEEFAMPLWQLGGRPFEPLGDGRLAVTHGLGEQRLGILDPASGELAGLDLPGYRTTNGALAVSGTTIATVAGGPRTPWSVLRVTADGAVEVMKKQQADGPGAAYLPDAHPVQLSGKQNGSVVHAIAYPPANPGYTGPAGKRPPYIVFVHGGPTAHSVPVMSLEKAFFTSRGIGVIDVNYGGSTGYGRQYRNRLRGQWGVVDVTDAYTAALGLAESGEADRARLGIRGGSAGGWTALACVTSGPGLTGAKEAVFAAATSYYGVSDLRPFVTDTHDFESRYLDGLIGALPEAEGLYAERAPVGHVNELTCPILLLQGLDDPIVPPSQSEAIAADLAKHHIPYAYLTFEGESHGFRKAETVTRSLEAELAFYGRIFDFTPPGIPPMALS